MKFRWSSASALLAIVAASSGIWTAPAMAEDAQNPDMQEILVTARKRTESILNVPVVETALPRETLERLQVKDLKDIATLVPGLALGDQVLSIGTQVSLRGVGTSSNDSGVDQSVSLNLDGLSLSNGLAYVSGAFDAGQIEVLKGPQALFYGKSSPGGVISIRTADPTDKFEVIGRAGYEVEAREKRAELIVSGPLSDNLKARVAGFYSDQDGFFKNTVVGPLPTPSSGRLGSDRLAAQRSWMIRGTLLWKPSNDFDARLKLNSVHDRTIDPGVLQLADCPTGVGPVFGFQFINPTEDCHLDRKTSWIEMNPAAYPTVEEGGLGFTDTSQHYGTIELNYRPDANLTLTSTTALYLLRSHSSLNATASSFDGPAVAATNKFRRREFTEELRLNSDYSGPLNFTLGGFLERGKISNLVGILGSTAIGLPAVLQNGTNFVNISTESLFGQARYAVAPQLELAAGVRWTSESRTNTGLDQTTATAVPVTRPTPRLSAKNWSPEFTVTYKPAENVTLFGSWKQGYKSGSFSIGTPPVQGLDNAFGDEKVQGGEIGLKSRWFDRRLLFNLAGYNYNYTGLQVGAVRQLSGGVPVTATVNAGSSIVRGIEAELVYRPAQVKDLSLRVDANYNHARYKSLVNIPCYGGQTIAQGCNLLFSPNQNAGAGGFTAQDSSGLPLARSATWQVNFGFDWEIPAGHDMKLVITNNQHFSTKMLTNLSLPFYQGAYIKSDLSLSLQGPRERWEVSLIGKNLGNKITTGTCVNSNLRAGVFPGTQFTGTNDSGPVGQDITGCYMDRGRELWLRLTFRPFN